MSERTDRELWELVAFDPVCWVVAELHQTLAASAIGSPREIEILRTVASLHTLVREMVYDRIERGIRE